MHVCLILFPGFSMLGLTLVREVFLAANSCAGQPLFSLQCRTITGAPIRSSDGMDVAPDQPGWDSRPGFDLVILCADQDPTGHLPMGLRAFLHRADAAGSTLAGLDGGVTILAALGLLAGRQAVLRPDAQQLDEAATISPSPRPFEFDRQRLTCGAGMAPLGALLTWIARIQGGDLAMQLASRLAVHHMGFLADQDAEPRETDPVLAEMRAIMAAHLDHPVPLERIAGELRLSPKQLRLRCRKSTGQTPARVYLDLRLSRAVQLVRETQLSVEDVATATGFASPSAFSRSFRSRYGAPPREIRKTA